MSESGMVPERRSASTGIEDFAIENSAYYAKAGRF